MKPVYSEEFRMEVCVLARRIGTREAATTRAVPHERVKEWLRRFRRLNAVAAAARRWRCLCSPTAMQVGATCRSCSNSAPF